jgi:hypothetical protein
MYNRIDGNCFVKQSALPQNEDDLQEGSNLQK